VATSVQPTSTLAIAKEKLKQLVVASPAFLARCKAANSADAMARVYKTYLRLPGGSAFDGARPFAVVEHWPMLEYDLFAGGAQNYLEPEGALGLYLTDNDQYLDDPDASGTDADNFAGGVIDDLAAAAAVNDNLSITKLSLIALRRSPQEVKSVQQSYWEAFVRVEWKS
jgi:hypothetical protein